MSDRFRNDFLSFNEISTENRTENTIVPLIKKVEFQYDQHETSEFHIIGSEYYKRNNAALFLECKILLLSSKGSVKTTNSLN